MNGIAPLRAERIRERLVQLSPDAAGGHRPITIVVEQLVDSTNDLALASLDGDSPDGSIFVAEEQRRGRGRSGRAWLSPRVGNIYFSMLWRFASTDDTNGLSLAAGVAIVHTLGDFGVHGLGLKWPNDILWRRRKLAGVLVELRRTPSGSLGVVLGIGINFCLPVASREQVDQPCVDLSTVIAGSGVRHALPSRDAVVAVLTHRLHALLAHYPQSGFARWRAPWQDLDVSLERRVELRGATRSVSGIAAGVDDDGALRIRTGRGLELCRGGTLHIAR